MSNNEFSATLPRILVVDDEAIVLRFLSDALGETAEFSLYEAENGYAALAAAASVKPDIILLDIGLPDMTGTEVIRRIREWSQVPIIVISVQEQEDDKVIALDAGADDYLNKPVGIKELLARIHAVLRRPLRQAPETLKSFNRLHDVLSARESEILFWVKEGKSNWEIAVILDISERTVKFHIRSIMTKLNAVNRSHALAIAIRHCIIAVE